ncbi:Fe-S cluster assembly protein HesB [Paenibacillaceae bacterium]|nr:Fe-S cluster assembly protein HesB [Paenibacillaceae bacterium]
MKLTITEAALNCFLNEWGFQAGDEVRIYTRYSSGGREGFSLGLMKATPLYPAISIVEGRVTFFMEEKDIWYLEKTDLIVDCDKEGIVFQFVGED